MLSGMKTSTSLRSLSLIRKFLLTLMLFFTVNSSAAQEQSSPIAVRNQIAQPGQPITTMRHWKIKKGSFPQFLKASQEGVWPYFEKIGARVVGMWQVLNVIPDDKAGGMENSGYQVISDNGNDYDEVYLVTRYASLDHWQATPWSHALTLETLVRSPEPPQPTDRSLRGQASPCRWHPQRH